MKSCDRGLKKVLIITTHFAPSIHVGAKRVMKFSKFLPEYGWQPVVLTKDVKCYHRIDESLNEELPEAFPMYRVKEWSLFGKNGENKNAEEAELNKPDELRNKRLAPFVIKILDQFLFYDYSWMFPAFFMSLRIIKKEKIDIIFSTYPNIESHLVGLLLKVFTRKKWICEFRDPWTLLHSVYHVTSAFQKRTDKYLERLILKKSDHIITVGENLKDLLMVISDSKRGNKISVIYNGYDRDDFSNLVESKKQRDKFVVTYLGTWGTLRTPEYFLRAMKNLLKEREELRKKMRVNFVGEVKFDPGLELRINRIIQSYGLNGIVNKISFVSHKEALERLHESDVSLLVGRPETEDSDNCWVVTSKLFEYLYIRKPILALVPPNGEAAKIIKEANAGEVVHPTDIKAIENKIYEMFEAFKNGKLKCSSKTSEVGKYERKKQTGELSKIFNSFS